MRNVTKTTIVAIGVILIALSLTAGFAFGKIDLTEYTAGLGAVGAFGAGVIGWLAADNKKVG